MENILLSTKVKIYVNDKPLGLVQAMDLRFEVDKDLLIRAKLTRLSEKNIKKGKVEKYKINKEFSDKLFVHKILNDADGFLHVFLKFSGRLKEFSK
jgi:hypothetical protein